MGSGSRRNGGANRRPGAGDRFFASVRERLLEAYETVRVIAAFVAFSALLGLTQPGALAPRGSQKAESRSTPPPMRAVLRETSELWLIDGFNVLNVAILHGDERENFWRREARERLLAVVNGFPDPSRVVLVFDGSRPLTVGDELPNRSGVRLVFAPDADEWLLRAVRDSGDSSRVVVVSADRRLAERAKHRGARVVSPTQFVADCGGAEPPATPGPREAFAKARSPGDAG